MYVITHHHDYDEVLLGPIEWNPRFIASVLQTDLDLPMKPSVTDSDKNKVPYDIIENVRVRPVVFDIPEHNPKIQHLIGPYWSYTENEATASYVVENRNIDLIRSELKQQVAAERYNREVRGTKITIQEQEVSVDTTRENRDRYAQKYLLMGDTDTIEWKFPEGWFTLTKEELGSVVTACDNHVQSAFNWELNKSIEVDAAVDHETLNSVVLIEA
jgi:hypothetical protein